MERVASSSTRPTRPGAAWSFTVYAFPDTSAAEVGEAALLSDIPASGQPVQVDVLDGTPVTGLTTVDPAADQLVGTVDSASAFAASISSGDVTIDARYLVIRDDTFVSFWGLLSQSEGGDMVATPLATSGLTDLAAPWFAAARGSGALIDRLPTAELLPPGYSEIFTAENLAELETDMATATPAA